LSYLEVFSKILPVVILFLVGTVFRKFHFIKVETIEDLKKLIIHVSLPALLFLSFSKTNFESKHLLIIVAVFAAVLVALLIGKGIQSFIGIQSSYFPLLLTNFEAGMLGYSIFSVLFGEEHIYIFAIIDLGQVTFFYLVIAGILTNLRDGHSTKKEQFTSFMKNPILLAVIFGVIVQKTGFITFLSGNPLSNSILQTAALIATITTPLICLVIGYEIQIEKSSIGKVVKVVVIRMMMLFMFGLLINNFIINRLLHLDQLFMAAVITMFMLPPPFVIPLFIKGEDKENRIFVNNVLSVHTVVTIIVMMFVGALFIK
jgi:malate permease and related proteins